MSTKLLLIDNYDSFTYNLVQAFLVLGAEVHVHRNDRIGLDEAEALEPTHLCISPGPGKPADSGISMRMIERFMGRIPVLGVCLGHQAIVEVFGGAVVRAPRLMHGKASSVSHDGRGLFESMPESPGVPGPGEMHRCVGASASASSRSMRSLRCTRTSAPSTRKACTRL